MVLNLMHKVHTQSKDIIYVLSLSNIGFKFAVVHTFNVTVSYVFLLFFSLFYALLFIQGSRDVLLDLRGDGKW